MGDAKQIPPVRPVPAFLITIDTEGDNLWQRPRTITTRNAAYLPRFQALCERHALRPTYLTDWEMVNCPRFQPFARGALSRGACEIGMHLHAWNSPPIVALTDDDYLHQPYLVSYPEQQIREKVKVLTCKLEETFGIKMVSHRAGRWAFDSRYARALADHGYKVDCSVTPYTSWRGSSERAPGGEGTDYSTFPPHAYFFDPSDISKPAAQVEGGLLEVPVTICPWRLPAVSRMARRTLSIAGSVGPKAADVLFPRHVWLRPRRLFRKRLLRVLSLAVAGGHEYVEFMLHSSELMPAGSPFFTSEASIEALYEDLEELFAAAKRLGFCGLTLAEFYARKTDSSAGACAA